jgi:sugar/nucleoside kinase (ribokinase family)
VDFVAIGHVTLDQTPGGTRPGGAAYYAAIAARRLGLRVAVLTSCGPAFPADAFPSDVEVVNVPSDRTTVFEINESARGRHLRVLSRAADIEEGHLPSRWREAPLAMLCPVINEVDPVLCTSFTEASLAVLPQGWMRQRAAGGAITPGAWEDADVVLPQAQVLVMSAEDIEHVSKTALEWFQHVPLAAVTRGSEGAALFVNGEQYPVEPDRARPVDTIGAGDVFATVLLIEYQREGNPWEAAAAAACAAAASVEAVGPAGIPGRSALLARLAAYHRRLGG